MAIKLSTLSGKQGRIVRETTAPFTYIDDEGKQVTEPFRIRFASLSMAEQQSLKAKVGDAAKTSGMAYWADILEPVIESFPDLIGDDGLPVPVTRELLENINGANLQAIYNAIGEAPLPKLPGTK